MLRLTFGLMVAALALPLFGGAGQKPGPSIAVYKDPGCGCCAKWVEHLRQHGFEATATDHADMDSLKDKHQIPQQARSCHTGIVDGYVVEGHVPAADIQRLLKERPAVVGIATPGMPVGSPGMEVEGMPADRYNVVSFDKTGTTRVFATH
jgi:hypothetical protein